MKNRSEAFGRLLKAGIGSIASCEGRTAAVVEEELGAVIGVSGDTIQRYKSGFVPPETRTVQLLAEAAVRRGFLGREWLERFLAAARYPAPDRLLDELCPAPRQRPRPPRIYENLPAPTYSQFVMREQSFAEVADGLRMRTAVVVVVGMGGNGKTSLAREIASCALNVHPSVPRFDAIVWTSDKDHPGTTNLSTVLDTIAQTLDYSGFAHLPFEEKRWEVEQLLRTQRVLLVIDNIETITDAALIAWLPRFPEPSKVLITSREYRREFRRGSWPVELRGMREVEARAFVAERLHMLRLDSLWHEEHIEPILAATGGNPKALEVALGIAKYEGRTIEQIADDLAAARGELFTDLFARAWSLLDEAARRLLLVTTFFPTSTSADALAAAGGIAPGAAARAIERLGDLGLLELQQRDLATPPRYTLHPLVRAFATAEIAHYTDFELQARVRWVDWYINLVAPIGFCWSDLSKLLALDPEQETLYHLIQWTFAQGLFEQTIRLQRGSGYYYYVRGLWARCLHINDLRIKAARQIGDVFVEVKGLASRVEILGTQGEAAAAEPYLERLRDLAGPLCGDHRKAQWSLHQSEAFVAMAQGKLDLAIEHWQKAAAAVDPESILSVFTVRSLGVCLFRQGHLAKARVAFEQALTAATRLGHQRSIMFNSIRLAAVACAEHQIAEAETLLTVADAAIKEFHDRPMQAYSCQVRAAIALHQGDRMAARAAVAVALDLFERLGMRREEAETRHMLTDVEAGAVSDMDTARHTPFTGAGEGRGVPPP